MKSPASLPDRLPSANPLLSEEWKSNDEQIDALIGLAEDLRGHLQTCETQLENRIDEIEAQQAQLKVDLKELNEALTDVRKGLKATET